MKFLCGSCRTKYQISDDKVRGKILTIRCKKCGAKVMVKESLTRQGAIAIAPLSDEEAKPVAASASAASAASAVTSRAAASASLASAFEVAMAGALDDMPTSIAPTPANEADAGVEWYVAMEGQQTGPFAYAELVRRLQNREVVGRHYVWHDGFDNWKRVRDVPDLVPYLPPDMGSKKKPPPLPVPVVEPAPDSGKVVDFAQKRAERERKGSTRFEGPSGAPGLPPLSDPPPEAMTAKAVPTHSGRADRLEQLDSVLNEALGIQGEGKTTRADPHGASPLGSVGLPSAGLTNDAFADDHSSDSFIPENLFDAVPRASASELVNRESTRFFVAAAGVNSQKSKARVGLIAGVTAAALLLSFVGLWASGIIEVSIPGIGNPFARKAQVDGDEEIADKELSEEELRTLKQLLDRGESRRAAIREIRKKRRPAKSPGLPGGYVDDGHAASTSGGSRGSETAESVGIDGKLALGGPMEKPEAEINLPGANLSNVPLPGGSDRLAPAAIKRVVQEGRPGIQNCYQRELKGNQDLRGKLEFLVTVQPSGEVSRAAVSSPNFKGTALAQCIGDRIRDWKFPPFDGEAQQVVVPFVLERASY